MPLIGGRMCYIINLGKYSNLSFAYYTKHVISNANALRACELGTRLQLGS